MSKRAGFDLATNRYGRDFGFNWNRALGNGGLLVGDDADISLEMVQKKPAA
jgi:hypothetical protein